MFPGSGDLGMQLLGRALRCMESIAPSGIQLLWVPLIDLQWDRILLPALGLSLWVTEAPPCWNSAQAESLGSEIESLLEQLLSHYASCFLKFINVWPKNCTLGDSKQLM